MSTRLSLQRIKEQCELLELIVLHYGHYGMKTEKLRFLTKLFKGGHLYSCAKCMIFTRNQFLTHSYDYVAYRKFIDCIFVWFEIELSFPNTCAFALNGLLFVSAIDLRLTDSGVARVCAARVGLKNRTKSCVPLRHDFRSKVVFSKKRSLPPNVPPLDLPPGTDPP